MREQATVLEAGEGTVFTARGSAMFFKATRASTNGAFSLMERTLPPGGQKPPPHIHTNCEEAFYVLDGEVEFTLGAMTTVGRTDTFVLVPGGVAHSFVNSSDRSARVLILHSPALDGYFRKLHELWLGPAPTVEQERDLMRAFGLEPTD